MKQIIQTLAVGAVLSACLGPFDDDEQADRQPVELGTSESEIFVTPGATYQIQNRGGECLDLPNFSRSAGIALQGHACKLAGYQGNQQFTVEAVTGGYRLRAFDSQLCLDLPSGSTADGTIVQQSDCHSGLNQIWNLQDESGYARITSALDAAKCIHIDAAHAVRLSRCTAVSFSARGFGFNPSRTYVSFHQGGKCLDLADYTTETGASPQLFACKTTNTTNQEWTLQPMAAGTFVLRSRSSDKCLEVGGWAQQLGSVEQTECRANPPQVTWRQWKLVPWTSTTWHLVSSYDDKCALTLPYRAGLSENLCWLPPPADPEFEIQPGAW